METADELDVHAKHRRSIGPWVCNRNIYVLITDMITARFGFRVFMSPELWVQALFTANWVHDQFPEVLLQGLKVLQVLSHFLFDMNFGRRHPVLVVTPVR